MIPAAAEREGLHRAIFIVRLVRDPLGQVTGVVERVRTGEKERVGAVEEVSAILTTMLARDEEAPGSKRA